MDLVNTLLWPLRWLIELGLTSFHGALVLLGLDPAAGLTWALAILGLVIVVRLIVLPFTIQSVRSSRAMALIAPEIQAIQQRYQGQHNDAAARAAMSAELFAVYKGANTTPFGAIIPVIIQIPIFIALYSVLQTAQRDLAGVGTLSKALADSFSSATLFGVPLQSHIIGATGSALYVSLGLVILVTLLQFLTQLFVYLFNRPGGLPQGTPAAILQRVLLYIFPALFAVFSLAVPLGLLLYLAFSSVWTLLQTMLVTYYLPTMNSRAAGWRRRS